MSAWHGWLFARLGVAANAPVAVATSGGSVWISAASGLAASRGPVVGMVRFAESGAFFGAGVSDRALLAGMRTRGSHAFLAAAGGIAMATPTFSGDAGSSSGARHGAFAYDLSAHAAYAVAGGSLSISGVAGPAATSYVAVTLGLELGWFGDGR